VTHRPDEPLTDEPPTDEPVNHWAQALVAGVRDRLPVLADPARAPAMRAYMRDQFRFLGVGTPQRRRAVRAVLAGLPAPDGGAVLAGAERLWALPEREYTYAACDVLARHQRLLGPEALAGRLRNLVLARPWWDSVDALAGGAIRPLLARHDELAEVMWAWSGSGDRWLVRVAITHQLGRKADTDPDRLFRLCAAHEQDREFFVAKAIGWALRDYAYCDPAAVRAFVAAHPALAPVARREALKHLH